MRHKFCTIATISLLGGYLISNNQLVQADIFDEPLQNIKEMKVVKSKEIHPEINNSTEYISNNNYEKLEKCLTNQLGKPYVWGATGPDNFDCSGLCQYVFKNALNISLNRTAEQQFHQCHAINHQQVKPGDLVFFSYNNGKTIDHVGIIVSGTNMMIDAQNNGVVKESYTSPWWKANIASFGRIIK